MTALHPGLLPFRALLALFDPAVAGALAPMVDRLARAMGPLAADSALPEGEPAGYDGIAARGTYERLLPSEWLMADEVPEEFLRRAATGEHLFFDLAREHPRGGRATRVVIDAGPELFGTPRIGALAALLVLAQRASVAKAAFSFRLAQSDHAPFEKVDPSTVGAFLKALASFPIDAELLRRASADAAKRSGETWLVSGPRGAAVARGMGLSVVEVDDVLEPEVSAVAVKVTARGRPERALRLPLPDGPSCVRVLRDPFPRAAPKTSSAQARGRLAVARPVVAVGRANAFARLEDGGLLMLPLPRFKRQHLGNGRILRPEGTGEIVAAGFVGAKPAVVGQDGDDLVLATFRGRGQILRRRGKALEPLRPPSMDGRLFPLATVGDAILFVGRGGRLLHFRPGNRAFLVTADCCGPVQNGRHLTFAVSGDPTTSLVTLRKPRDMHASEFRWLGIPAERPLIAGAAGAVAFAYEVNEGVWNATVVDAEATEQEARKKEGLRAPAKNAEGPGGRTIQVDVGASSEVVGVLPGETAEGWPALVVLDEAGTNLRVVRGGHGEDSSIALPARAVHAVVDAPTRTVVCVTDTAELVIAALAWGVVFARISGDGGRGA